MLCRDGPGPDSCTAKRALLFDHAITRLLAYTTGSGLMKSTYTKPMTHTNSTTTAGQAFSTSASAPYRLIAVVSARATQKAVELRITTDIGRGGRAPPTAP
jgi:hypothetical protein